jgi:hypothetical protein
MRATARPLLGPHAFVEIAAAAPVGVGHDRLTAGFVEADVLRGLSRGDSDGHSREDAVARLDGPLQHLHAADRSADGEENVGDAQPFQQRDLRARHVGDGDHREVCAPVGAVRLQAGRAGRAHAAAQHVGTDDEEAVGIDRQAGTNDQRPPFGAAGDRVRAGGELVAGEGVADDDDIALVGVERAPGLVGDLDMFEHAAAIQLQGPVRGRDGQVFQPVRAAEGAGGRLHGAEPRSGRTWNEAIGRNGSFAQGDVIARG